MKVFLRAEDREYSDIAIGVRSEDVALLYERGGFGKKKEGKEGRRLSF